MDSQLTNELAKILTHGGWLFYTIAFILSLLGSFLGAYVAKRGEFRAIQDDFEGIKIQLRESTEITAGIQSDISKRDWVEQQRWELRRDLYLELIKQLLEARTSLSAIHQAEFEYFEGTQQQKRVFLTEQNERNYQATCEIRKLIQQIGILFLSEKTLEILSTYLRAENIRIENLAKRESEHGDENGDVSAEATSYGDHLDNEYNAVQIAYQSIVETAKTDLRIDHT